MYHRGERIMGLMMVLESNRTQTFDDAYGYLVSMSSGGVSEYLAVMLASLMAGRGAMPRYLGLAKVDFDALLHHHFPGIDPRQFYYYGKPLPSDRLDEMA